MAKVPSDRIGSLFASSRLSRRQAIQRSAVGAAAAGLAAMGAKAVTAQDATPTDEMASATEYLFVLAGFTSGTFTSNDGGGHEVALEGAPDQMVYFADRPGREVGTIPAEQGLGMLGLDSDDPPNAALVIALEDGTTDSVVLELTGFELDTASGVLTLQVAVLDGDALGEDGMSLAEAPLAADAIPASFDGSSLFIDALVGCGTPWDPCGD